MKLSVILPAYNEENTIRVVLDAVLQVDLSLSAEPVETEFIVVDDASSDNTAEIVAHEPRVKLIRHRKNQGKGVAIQTALAHVTGDIVLIQDADMEYSVADYPTLLRPFAKPHVQVVYGSRFLKRKHPTNMKWVNFFANRILTLAANLLYSAQITDEATCFKVFRVEVLKSLPLAACGFDFCPEVTALVRLRGISIHEVPIEYSARTVAQGKKVKWVDGFQALKTLIVNRLRPR